VVVVDEKGQFAISLLSGHLGGANLLATQLADLMGATPVITTATDVQGLPAIDMVAKKLGLRIDSFKQLKFINSAIVNRGTVDIYTDIDRPSLLRRCPELEISTIAIKPIAEYNVQQITADVVVLISDRVLEQASVPTLVLRPQTLSIGIGCRRGTSEQEIINAILRSCEEAQRSPNAIRGLHTAWVKFDEDGLLQAGKSLQVPVVCYSQAQLQKTIDQYEIPTSQYVMEQIGVGAVCEPAAILGTRQGNLILPKRSYSGITVAIAEDSYPWWGSAPAI
jgi:cobalt-precorrin 5A hydrolase